MMNRTPIRLPKNATAEQVAANIRGYRSAATPDQTAEGTDWYPLNGSAIAEIASDAFDATGDYVAPDAACAIFAAYSQNASWKANVTMATRYLNGSGPFGLTNVRREVSEIEEIVAAGGDPLSVDLGLKRGPFAANLAGDLKPVTCDRHHIEVGFGQRLPLTVELRATLQEATEIVAAEFGEDPAITQAICWVVKRGTGK